MKDPRSISQKAIALLDTLGCDPTPKAYAVAYAYVEDPDGDLAAEMMGEVARSKRLRLSEVERLHASHLEPGKAAFEETAGAFGLRLGEAMGIVGESVASSEAAAARIEDLGGGDADGLAARVLRDAAEAQGGLLRRLQEKNDELDAMRRRYQETLEEARRDPLTGLSNRRSYDERLAVALSDAALDGRPVSLLIGDIDHFKGINDAYGHAVGDQVIKLIGKTMRGAVRGHDTAARIGGEEYGIVLVGADLQQATAVAERIRSTVDNFRRLAAGSDGARRKVTVSIGVAQAGPGEGPASLYERADARLYEAKRTGRNRVVSEEPAAPEPASAPGP